MRRTLVVLTIVVLAVLLVATPGLAAGSQNRHGLRGGGGGQGSTSFNLLGTIVSYSCGNEGYIKVAVITPDKYGDTVLTVQTTDSTRFKECDYVVSVRIDCSDLVSGSQVRIMGTVDGKSFVATRVIQYTLSAE